MKTQCANCQRYWRDHELVYPVPHLHERLEPGDMAPEGACPDCGAFCYPVKNKPVVCSRCGGHLGVHEYEGHHMVYTPCYHCRDEGTCDCSECHEVAREVEREKAGL